MRAGQPLGVRALDLQMLGRDRVDQRHGVVERADQDDRAEIAPGGAGDRGARQRLELRRDRALDRVGERRHRR